ncbi:hypothetical protein PAXRUDRAFT_824385 [Paxillus rubicundulus Ve08.2h10]|uniref:Uncharacterized protein n=1 Tax=Paxillus rubicundulus Ve08.2h10 TaxID=930991 RepID=A0A0D0DUJ4_9AGAM|nr:hypothetical protein PAXRUDRAFT_824385 [Paxillus rubicundulus Ve08.2h10]
MHLELVLQNARKGGGPMPTLGAQTPLLWSEEDTSDVSGAFKKTSQTRVRNMLTAIIFQ